LPTGEVWRYEPKLDGFRGLLWRHASAMVQLLSRNGRDLGPWFPELVQAGQTLPPTTLVDGEIVIADDTGCADFGALQTRLTMARTHLARTAPTRPAVLVVFDLLEVDGRNLMDEPLTSRRRQLEHLLDGRGHPCLQLMEQTADLALARDWLTLLPSIEGVVAKRADGRYGTGRRREWVKVKRYRSAECVVIGIAGDFGAPKLVLGLRHADGEVHHLGVTRQLQPEQLGPIADLLERAGPEEGAIPSRWQHDAVPPWRRISPEVVCEVRFGTIDNGRWLRQPATFLRWRPDRSPGDCHLDQLSR
jgi:ATP-dependent DNA ligase